MLQLTAFFLAIANIGGKIYFAGGGNLFGSAGGMGSNFPTVFIKEKELDCAQVG